MPPRPTVTRILAAAVLAVMLASCSRKNRCLEKGAEVNIEGDHPHSASVPAEQIERGAGRTYPVRGADHEHAFVLTDEATQKLGRGEPLVTRTSSVKAHVHEVTIRCKE